MRAFRKRKITGKKSLRRYFCVYEARRCKRGEEGGGGGASPPSAVEITGARPVFFARRSSSSPAISRPIIQMKREMEAEESYNPGAGSHFAVWGGGPPVGRSDQIYQSGKQHRRNNVGGRENLRFPFFWMQSTKRFKQKSELFLVLQDFFGLT